MKQECRAPEESDAENEKTWFRMDSIKHIKLPHAVQEGTLAKMQKLLLRFIHSFIVFSFIHFFLSTQHALLYC